MKKSLLSLLIIFFALLSEAQQTFSTVRVTQHQYFNGSSGTINRGVRLSNSNFLNNLSYLSIYPETGSNVGVGVRIIPKGLGISGQYKSKLEFYGTDYNANQVNYYRLQLGISPDGSYAEVGSVGNGNISAVPIKLRVANVDVLSLSNSQGGRFSLPTGYASTTDFATLGENDFVTKGQLALIADSVLIQSIVTTNSTPTSLDTVYIPQGHAVNVKITMVGENTANGHVFSGSKEATIKNIGGTYTIVGSVQTVSADQKEASLSGVVWTISLVNSLPVVRVTGVDATTIEWETTYYKTYKVLN